MSHDWVDRQREVAQLRGREDEVAFARLTVLLQDDDLLVCIHAADALLDGWHATGLSAILIAASHADEQLKATLWGVLHERAAADPIEFAGWISGLRTSPTSDLSVALERYETAPW